MARMYADTFIFLDDDLDSCCAANEKTETQHPPSRLRYVRNLRFFRVGFRT